MVKEDIYIFIYLIVKFIMVDSYLVGFHKINQLPYQRQMAKDIFRQ